MAGPYPGYGPQAASVAAYEPSWFERLIAALATDKSAPEVDAPSGVEYPAGVSAKPLLELSGLAGAARLTANVRAGHPVTNINAPSYAGQYGDVLDTVGLAAPAVALGMKGLAKGAGAVADSFVANSGARARQRGAIRAGGDERLIPSHATDLEGLESARDSLGPNMLYSPSIGINLNKVNRFKDQNSEGTIYLIPKIGAFDPATSASVLYNRDAYLPRHSSYAINQWGGGKTGENLAFDKGLANLRLIGGEGKQIPKSNPESIQMTWSNTAGHKAALANSPHFKSFAQYESSPAGMATLVEGPKQLVKDAVEPLYAAYRKDMREAAKGIGIPMATPADEARFSAVTRPLIYGNRAEREQVLQGLVQAYGPDALTEIGGTAAKYRQRFSRAPAEYAELQPQGLTPLTEENWAGAMVAGKAAGIRRRGLLKNLPVEYFEPGTLTADDMKRFQGEYGLARRQPIGQRLQLSAADRDPPKTPAPYLTGLAGAYNPAQKGAQKGFQAPKGLPDAFAFSGMKVPDDIMEGLAIPLWNEKEAAEHLKFIGTQWPLVTNPAAKKDYEVALAGVLQLMKKKGWKPLPETNQVIAGLDEVFSNSKAHPGLVAGLLKEAQLSPDVDWLQQELAYATSMFEKYKPTAKPEVLAGWVEKIDSIKEAIKQSKGPKPNTMLDDLAKGDWEPEPDPLAALGEVMPWWKTDKPTIGDWKAASAKAKAALPPAPAGTSHSAGIDPAMIQQFHDTAKSKGNPSQMVDYLQGEIDHANAMVSHFTATGQPGLAAGWKAHGVTATAALEQFDFLMPALTKAKKVWGKGAGMGDELPDLVGEAPTPAGVLDFVLGKNWDVEVADGDVAQAIIAHWGFKIKPDTLSLALEKAPSWTQDNVIKLLVQQGVKIGNATPEETLAALQKPLTSTGDSALDAEIDALAKGLEPAASVDDWLDVSPTGIPWKNVAGSFESLLEEVATPGVLPEQGVADFVDLFKEAGGKVIKGKNAGGQHTFLFEGTNGKDYMASLDELANDSEHFEVILKQLLPQVWSHVKKASK